MNSRSRPDRVPSLLRGAQVCLYPSRYVQQRMQQILSAATVAAIGLSCKAYLHSGLCSISVRGLPHLLETLNSPERQTGQGVVTGIMCFFFPLPLVADTNHAKVSNHLSTCAVPVPSLVRS